MANALAFAICSATTGAPVTGAAAACVRSAWRVADLSSWPAPPVVETGGGYELRPTDADADAGIVVLIDVGVGKEATGGSQFIVFEVSRVDRRNQFFAWHFTDEDGALWPGGGGSFGGWNGPGSPPAIVSPGTGVFIAIPTEADVLADASGRIDAPAGAVPDQYTVDCEAFGPWVAPSSGPLKNPAADVVAFLDAKQAGATTLTRSTNLFIGHMRSFERTTAPAVFALNSGGGSPEPYVQGHRTALFRPTVQVLIRGPAGDLEAGENLARGVYAWLHQRVVTGYTSWYARDSAPALVSVEDSAQHPVWSINLECQYRSRLD